MHLLDVSELIVSSAAFDVAQAGLTRSGVTGVDGKYEIRVPPGHYRLHAEAPADIHPLIYYAGGKDTELQDARGCAVTDISVGYDKKVSARNRN